MSVSTSSLEHSPLGQDQAYLTSISLLCDTHLSGSIHRSTQLLQGTSVKNNNAGASVKQQLASLVLWAIYSPFHISGFSFNIVSYEMLLTQIYITPYDHEYIQAKPTCQNSKKASTPSVSEDAKKLDLLDMVDKHMKLYSYYC